MATQYQPKPFVINLNDLVYLLAQVNFVPLFDGPANSNGIVNFDSLTMDAWDARGHQVWDAETQTGSYQGTALSAANVALLGQGFPQVSSPIGIRDVSGLHNNLFGTQADWGAVDVPFRRDIPADFDNYITTPGADYSTTVDGNGFVTQSSVIDLMPRIISQTITTAGVNLLKDAGGHYVEWDAARYGSDTAYASLVDASGIDVLQLVEGAKIVAPVNTEVAVLDANGAPLVWNLTQYQTSVVYTTTLAVLSASSFGGLKDATGGTLEEGEAIWYRPIPGGALVNTLQTYQPDVLAYKQLIDANVDFSAGYPANNSPVVTTLSESGYGLLETLGHIDFQNPDSGEFFIGSENPGVAPVNSWFAIFGQFFDHGLDKIGSGGQGTKITISLDPSDPLYGVIGPDGQPTTKITVSRATVAGADANGDPNYVNHTSPFIDQSQTYGSVDQITQILREWVPDQASPGGFKAGMELFDGQTLVDGWIQRTPVYNPTTGLTEIQANEVHNTLPTLSELRDHVLDTSRAALTWEDVADLRNRNADGNLDTGNSGHALILDMNPRFDAAHLDSSQAVGATTVDALVDSAVTTLNDSLAGSGMSFGRSVSGSIELTITGGAGGPFLPDGTYTGATALAPWVNFANFNITAPAGAVHDAVGEILMAAVGDHYIAGDGRVNENFGLTSIHHVFHEEHNFQVENLKSWIYQHDANNSPLDHAGLHAWQIDTGTQDGNGNFTYGLGGDIAWDADKMFNAAKLIVEMEYQHAAVDQYARTVTPRIQEFVGYSSGVDSTVSLEFSQVAFRFGHSTIRETIDTIDPAGWMLGNVTKYALEKAFLNPQAFADEGVAAITLGLARQQMNEVDEFITPALTQGLLDLPLDLAAINIARGRDLGIPTLNDFRAAIGLAEYTSWIDYGAGMIHPESLVNFIAAYSFNGDVEKAQYILDLADGLPVSTNPFADPVTDSDAIAFLINNDGGNAELNAARSGFDHIDSWIGGLAEAHVPGGLLGETFDAVFVAQIQSLMDGDRFYYLYRLFGTQIHEEVNNGQFKDIVERNTGLEHLNGSIFAYADKYYDFTRDADLNTAGVQDNLAEHAYALLTATGTGLGVYSDGGASTATNGSAITVDGQTYIRDVRPELDPSQVHTVEGTPTSGADSHEVIVATDNNDFIHARAGDDTVYGEGGDDIIYGDGGVDRLYGGDGDDYIDTGEGPDLADGGAGKDTIYGRGSGSEVGGFDQLVGGSGNDTLIGGEGIDKLSGGSGDDVIYGDGLTSTEFGNTDPFTHGGDGNDYIDGGASGDLLYGEEGDDLVIGGNDQDLISGGTGDDILRPGNPSQAINGGPDEVIGDDGYTNTGFDLIDFSDYTGSSPGVVADMVTQFNPLAAIDGTTPFPAWFQIEGVIGTQNNDTFIGTDALNPAEELNLFGGSNWLVGGSGDDTFRGNGGNDLIVGGSIRLDTLIGRYIGQAGYLDDTENAYTGASNRATGDLDGSGLIDAVNATIAGTAEDFAKHFTDMLRSQIFKDQVLGDGGIDGAADSVLFSGNRLDYDVTRLVFIDGNNHQVTAYKIVDNGGLNSDGSVRTALDGIDVVTGVEQFEFSDGTFSVAQLLNVPPVITTNGGNSLSLAALDENTAADTTVIQLAVSDANATNPTDPLYPQALQWTLSGGSAGLFQIDNTGRISLAASPNYEALAIAGQTHQVLTATVSDGSFSDTIEITLDIANVNEAASGAPAIANYIHTNGGERITLVASSTLVDPDLVTATNPTGGDTGYQWQRLQNNAWVNINNATNATLTNQQNTTVRLTQTYTDPFGQQTVVSAETAIITGSGGNNVRTGTSGKDILLGLDGNDTLTGGAGNDRIDGGDDNDRFVATIGDGNDTYRGGAGSDTYDLSGTNANATVNLVNGTASSSETGSDTLSSVENVIGSNGVNTITGTSNANRIEGRGGNDVINGGGGGDTLLGGAGADHISGGTGADVIIGGAGADRIDLGNPTDNNRDVVRLTATGDYGDEVFDFRSNGTNSQRDVLSLSAALNAKFDDVANDNQLQIASSNSFLPLFVNLDSVEALYLNGAEAQGVAAANLANATQVANAFNTNFWVAATAGQDAVLVINDTDANDFAVWQFQESGAQFGVQANELTLMARFHSNSTVTTGQFIFEN